MKIGFPAPFLTIYTWQIRETTLYFVFPCFIKNIMAPKLSFILNSKWFGAFKPRISSQRRWKTINKKREQPPVIFWYASIKSIAITFFKQWRKTYRPETQNGKRLFFFSFFFIDNIQIIVPFVVFLPPITALQLFVLVKLLVFTFVWEFSLSLFVIFINCCYYVEVCCHSSIQAATLLY